MPSWQRVPGLRSTRAAEATAKKKAPIAHDMAEVRGLISSNCWLPLHHSTPFTLSRLADPLVRNVCSDPYRALRSNRPVVLGPETSTNTTNHQLPNLPGPQRSSPSRPRPLALISHQQASVLESSTCLPLSLGQPWRTTLPMDGQVRPRNSMAPTPISAVTQVRRKPASSTITATTTPLSEAQQKEQNPPQIARPPVYYADS